MYMSISLSFSYTVTNWKAVGKKILFDLVYGLYNPEFPH